MMLGSSSLLRQVGNGRPNMPCVGMPAGLCNLASSQHHHRLPPSSLCPQSLPSAVVINSGTYQRSQQYTCKAATVSNGSDVNNNSSSGGGGGADDKLQKVLDGIDALNKQDPRTIEVIGAQVPYELAYSQWLTDWVIKLTQDEGAPPLSDELRIVARGQHVQRWTSPRSSYPEGKAAYLKWREDLKGMHARVVVGLMEAAGYPPESCATVQRIILKKNIREDQNSVIEDALVLVFLQYQLAEFRLKETEERMVDILRKSWKKLSPRGQAAALKLPLGKEEAALVQQALAAKPAA